MEITLSPEFNRTKTGGPLRESGQSIKKSAGVLLLCCAVSGAAFSCPPSNAASKLDKSSKFADSDKETVRKQLTELGGYIRSEDARGVASMFTKDGEYVDEDDNRSKGRAEIEATFADVFKDVGRPRIALSVDNIVVLSHDVVLIEGTSTSKVDNAVLSKFSILEVKEANSWKISRASEHNVPSPTTEACEGNDNLKDLRWLIGDWKAARGGVSVDMTARWVQNKNFIYCKYQVNRPNMEPTVDMQVIAWDPRLSQPVSWAFDSNGSFSSGRWFKQGSDWSVDASGVERDASATRSTNVLADINADSFTWRSLNRCINGLPITDSTPLVVHRIATDSGAAASTAGAKDGNKTGSMAGASTPGADDGGQE